MRTRLSILSGSLLLALASLVPGCGGDDDPISATLKLEANVAGAALACGSYSNVGSAGAEVELADARMFLSAFELRNADGEYVALELDQDSSFQHQNVALLDFENGTGSCADSGTPETNTEITGTLPAGTYDALRFQVGVPFELNHNDSATAPAPFNVPGMFWTWQGGYKFVRVDWLVTGGAVARWNVHIGSTGCTSGAPTEAPGEPCSRTNAAAVELDQFDMDADSVQIDLASIVAGADVTLNTADTPPGCQSNPGEPNECGSVFTALGLDFDNGKCVDGCKGQAVFGMAGQ